MSERVVFCRIAWMENYRGLCNESKSPHNGGQWVADGNVPWESYNFESFDGVVYGYSRPAKHSVNLERIDPSARGAQLDGVRVIFFAQGPSGQVIVGWYENATVLREARRGPNGLREDVWYLFICEADRATLLPVSERTHPIPRGKGGTGQSNWTYVLDSRGKPKKDEWLHQATAYVDRKCLDVFDSDIEG